MLEPTPPTRHRWFRFGLRSLLVFTALVGLLMGWIMKERVQSAREGEIAKLLEAEGWTVAYGGPFDAWKPTGNKQSWWRRWARNTLGERINYLYRSNRMVTDLSPLAGLSCLRVLDISNTRVVDLAPLAPLRSLRLVSFLDTNITHQQIEELRKALPDSEVFRSTS